MTQVKCNHEINKSVKEFNRKIRFYKKISGIKKIVICWHKDISDFIFFNIENLDYIKDSDNIEIIWIPDLSAEASAKELEK